MDIVFSFLTGIPSFVYIGQSAKKYLDFKKFERIGYIDDYHMVDGELTASNSMNSIVQDYKGHPSGNLIIKKLSVEIGKEKIGTNLIPISTGKTTIFIPQSYQYTDWKTLHNKLSFANNFVLGNIKLRMDNFIPFFTNNYVIKENNSRRLIDLYKTFDKHEIDYKNGDKIKVVEEYIHNTEKVTVFGKYISNEEMVVKYIGNKNQLITAVRQNICNLKYNRIALACCVLVGSISYLTLNFENAKKRYHNKY